MAPVGAARRHGAVHDMAAPGEVAPEMLSRTFPQWRIFRVLTQWWANREGLQKLTGPQSLIRHSLIASSPTALAEKLCLQEYLDQLTPENLAAVYQGVALHPDGTAG
jgi:hypothetical protein